MQEGIGLKTILVVAAHPDDEILGVGGTIRRHVTDGDKVLALILGEGQTSRWSSRDVADMECVEELHKNSMSAGEIVGFEKLFFENIPDNRFDSWDMLDVVKVVEKYIKEIMPDVVYTHHSGDLNIDHRVTYNAVLTATRPIGDYTVKEVYGFETVSSTEWQFGMRDKYFIPNMYVDVTDFIQFKIEAMNMYRSELCKYPHPRSLEMLDALASVRGATVGVMKAEAFEVIRIVR